MNRALFSLFAGLLTASALLLPATGQDQNAKAVTTKDIEALRAEIAALKKENETLRRENQTILKLLAERNGSTNTTAASTTPTNVPPRSAPAPAARTPATGGVRALNYWLSSSSTRHNSKCRYFGTGKGHACGPTEGKACGVCGG
jgi:hypothetical protein